MPAGGSRITPAPYEKAQASDGICKRQCGSNMIQSDTPHHEQICTEGTHTRYHQNSSTKHTKYPFKPQATPSHAHQGFTLLSSLNHSLTHVMLVRSRIRYVPLPHIPSGMLLASRLST